MQLFHEESCKVGLINIYQRITNVTSKLDIIFIANKTFFLILCWVEARSGYLCKSRKKGIRPNLTSIHDAVAITQKRVWQVSWSNQHNLAYLGLDWSSENDTQQREKKYTLRTSMNDRVI